MTYGLTAVISLLVVAIIVGISKLTSRPGQTVFLRPSSAFSSGRLQPNSFSR